MLILVRIMACYACHIPALFVTTTQLQARKLIISMDSAPGLPTIVIQLDICIQRLARTIAERCAQRCEGSGMTPSADFDESTVWKVRRMHNKLWFCRIRRFRVGGHVPASRAVARLAGDT